MNLKLMSLRLLRHHHHQWEWVEQGQLGVEWKDSYDKCVVFCARKNDEIYLLNHFVNDNNNKLLWLQHVFTQNGFFNLK